MKKLILFLLPLFALAQNPTNFPYGIKNAAGATNNTPTYIVTQETDGVHKKTPAAIIEKTANKTSTVTNYSETLYPNEKAVHDGLDMKLNISDLPTNLTLYPTNVASDVSGYVKMVTDIHDADYNTIAVDVSTPAITTTSQLVSRRISAPGVLIGQPGVFNITTFGNIRHLSGTGTATFYFEVYHRDSAGVETLICTSSISAPVVDGGYTEFTASALWDDGIFDATDRIVIKSYANRIAGGSDPVYQFQFGGVTPVRTLLPVPFSVVDAGYEMKVNKQNSLAVDGSGIKYPTVDAVNAALTPEGERLDSSFTNIFGWGDSLTEGSGQIPYATALNNITTFSITNRGVGGENSTQIKDRFIAETSAYSKSVIIWAGRNNFTDPTTVKADIATMISALGHTRYLVLSILNAESSGTSDYNTIIQLNNDLKTIYGSKYVDVRTYLVSLYNPSIPQDVLDNSNDVPPSSLRIDNIHLNSDGNEKVAEYLNTKLGVLFNKNEFIQSKDLSYYTQKYQKFNGTAGFLPLILSENTVGNSSLYEDSGVILPSIPNATTFGNPSNYFGGLFFRNAYIDYALTGNIETATIRNPSSVGYLRFRDYAYTTDLVRLYDNGEMLIGTITPTGSALTVGGSISATTYLGGATLTGTPTAPTATAGTNTTQLATTAFVQTASTANIVQTITNGVTTSAPSQDAVYDALALKANLIGATFNGQVETFNASFVTNQDYKLNSLSTGLVTTAGIGFSFTTGGGTGWVSSAPITATRFDGGIVRLKSYTVATLPTGVQGDTAFVTDATAPTYLGVLIGGGSIVAPVFYNGTTWVSH